MDRESLRTSYKPKARIALEMPGKLGDFLYVLPLAKYLSSAKETKVDIWTSDYCAPAKELVEYQSYVDNVIIPDDYIVERFDMGAQPPIQIPYGLYETVYSCTFRRVPDTRLDHFIAKSVGVEPNLLQRVQYEYPELIRDSLYDNEKIVVFAPRGETSYKDTFIKTMALLVTRGYIIYQIGAKGEAVGWSGIDNVDITGWSILDTVRFLGLKNIKGFVGLMSSQLVLANGFNMPKVSPHNGRSWDMRHVVYSNSNFYPIDPTPEEILEIIIENSNLE